MNDIVTSLTRQAYAEFKISSKNQHAEIGASDI